MSRSLDDYFARRIVEEEALALSATHQLVRAAHERFAAAYREQLAQDTPLPGRLPPAIG